MSKSYMAHKITLVQGLLTACPLDKPQDDCPIQKLRALSFKERLQLVKTMHETELDLIISHHRHCFQKRRWELHCEKWSGYYLQAGKADPSHSSGKLRGRIL
jgi:hypothetical protein